MADGRTISRYTRVYANGYDLSGETRSIGAMEWTFAQHLDKCLSWTVQSGLLGVATIKTGQLNSILRFDTVAASSPHDWLNGMHGGYVELMVPIGVRAVPAMGDPVWMTEQRANVHHVLSEGFYTITMDFEPAFIDGAGSTLINYDIPWGRLLHAYGNETGANAANTNVDNGAATSAGGWLMWQINSISGGAGNATVSIDDAAVGTGPWAALSGATSGAVAYNAVPASGIVQLASNATVRQYLRWQLALAGGATGCTFSLSFARGR